MNAIYNYSLAITKNVVRERFLRADLTAEQRVHAAVKWMLNVYASQLENGYYPSKENQPPLLTMWEFATDIDGAVHNLAVIATEPFRSNLPAEVTIHRVIKWLLIVFEHELPGGFFPSKENEEEIGSDEEVKVVFS
jgi:hypothetical protein